jgi:SAM-dependent methyltransferase
MNTEPGTPAEEMGLTVLLNISKAAGFNQWMFGSIRPYVKGKTLEIGSGIGNISSLFVRNKMPLFLSDHKEEYCQLLRKTFAGQPEVSGIFHVDLADKNFEVKYAGLLNTFDTVFALNVVEHIEDDVLAIANGAKLLTPGGHLILLLPAYPWLFNRWDQGLGHHRRYTGKSVRTLLSKEFDVVKIWYFNLAGIFGWWWFGSVLHRELISGAHMQIYEKFLPLFRLADKMSGRRIGLSVIGVGSKK